MTTRQGKLLGGALTLAAAAILLVVPAAHAAGSPPVTGQHKPRLNEQAAIALFKGDHKVAAWLSRYPKGKLVSSASYDEGSWSVEVFYTPAGEIAKGNVDDTFGAVTEALTGPQVAWGMARGEPGAFGGKTANSYAVWIWLCLAFFVGLVDWRRPFSVRTLDLIAFLSFAVSLWYFNQGHVFAAVVTAYPPLVWIFVRSLWISRRDRSPRGSPVWPVWVFVAATVFLGGFRYGVNVSTSNVIDVGYAGVIGADRIWHGESPYGHFPVEDNLPKCGPADSSGEVRDRVQADGRCESALPTGDTYGSVSYLSYLPAYLTLGWSGKWDDLPAAHATSILWDLVCIFGLVLVGRRFGGNRLAAILAFAWVSWPFTLYALSSNTNDMIQPAFGIFAFYFATSDVARGAFLALSSWVKLAPLALVPLWMGYPEARRFRPTLRFLLSFAATTVLVFSIFLLEPSPFQAAREFYKRTFEIQIDRHSPFSLWDWGQYHARGIPALHRVQQALEVVFIAFAVCLAWWPKHRSPLRLAALTTAVLVGFQLVLTHWSWLYLPWFFPFLALAWLAFPADDAEPELALDGDPHQITGNSAAVGAALD